MRTNKEGIDLIKSFEGLKLDAYPDPGTGGDPWTIGYGHTGQEVKKGMSITEEEAEEILKRDLMKFENGVINAVKVDINENQFAALVSFSFNMGLSNLRRSTLLRKLNAKDYNLGYEFSRWNKANGKIHKANGKIHKAKGKILNGLTKRREAEWKLFCKKIW